MTMLLDPTRAFSRGPKLDVARSCFALARVDGVMGLPPLGTCARSGFQQGAFQGLRAALARGRLRSPAPLACRQNGWQESTGVSQNMHLVENASVLAETPHWGARAGLDRATNTI